MAAASLWRSCPEELATGAEAGSGRGCRARWGNSQNSRDLGDHFDGWIEGPNFTRNGERAMFAVRIEDGVYHLTRDRERSIYAIWTGPHNGLVVGKQAQPRETVGIWRS